MPICSLCSSTLRCIIAIRSMRHVRRFHFPQPTRPGASTGASPRRACAPQSEHALHLVSQRPGFQHERSRLLRKSAAHSSSAICGAESASVFFLTAAPVRSFFGFSPAASRRRGLGGGPANRFFFGCFGAVAAGFLRGTGRASVSRSAGAGGSLGAWHTLVHPHPPAGNPARSEWTYRGTCLRTLVCHGSASARRTGLGRCDEGPAPHIVDLVLFRPPPQEEAVGTAGRPRPCGTATPPCPSS